MKVIVQIPCYNEERTLPETIRDIPRLIPGASSVEILVVDDGSSDRTIEIAQFHKVDHIIRHKKNRGLARTFRTGLEAALRLQADIIVNTDGDNQYCGADIVALVAPIIGGEYDLVVGDRQTNKVPHFSWQKRTLQRIGSLSVHKLSGSKIPDAVSGFRAISRNAALQLNIVSSFSYTIEMLIQANSKGISIGSVPVRVNPTTRESRLFKSVPEFIRKSVSTMFRIYAMYRPLRFFTAIAVVTFAVGVVPIGRFIVLYIIGEGAGHIQSLILGSALIILSAVLFCMGLLADLVGFNRQLLEMNLERMRRLAATGTSASSPTRSGSASAASSIALIRFQRMTAQHPRSKEQSGKRLEYALFAPA